MPSNHLILCHPLLLLPSIFPSIRVFSNESALHIRWPKYWSFSFSISPFNEHPGLSSFRMDWLDLLAVQGTQESSPTPQFKSINSSVLSFLYRPTLTSIHDHWENHSLDQYGYVCIYRYWYYVYISICILCELMWKMFGRIWMNALSDYTQVVGNFIYSLIHFCNSLNFLGVFWVFFFCNELVLFL